MSLGIELPLFQRYHAVVISSGKCKAELAALGLQLRACNIDSADASGASRSGSGDALLLEPLEGKPVPDEAAVLEAARAVVESALAKTVDANHWIGVQLGESNAFSEAVAEVHAAVRTHGHGSGDEAAVNVACLPPTRWTLCLGVLRIYTPRQLEAVTLALKELKEEIGIEKLSVTFEGLRSLGPTKLAAAVAREDAAALSQLAARLHDRLAAWSSGKPPAPHVTLVKFTYPFGDKKAKASSTQTAKRLALHKVDWSEQLAKMFAVSSVGPLPLGLHEMHAGGGAGMGDAAYAVVWSSTSATGCVDAQEPEPEPESR